MTDRALAARFDWGVASGDPTASSVVLWTRVAAHSPAELRWEIAPVDDPSALTATGAVVATDERDGTVQVRVDGLDPGTRYRFGFIGPGGERSAFGTTATLARQPGRLTLGVACCADWSEGPFDGYRWLADQSLDAVVHLGDYIYEKGADGPHRATDPPWDCVTLADYRRRYAQHHLDPALRDLHASAPWFSLWDDHEFADNASRRHSPSHRRAGMGHRWSDRRRAAEQANGEWLPRLTEADAPGPVDRHRRIGDLLDLIVLDTRMQGPRQPEDDAVGPSPAPQPSGDRRILSDQQWRWLEDVLSRPAPRWTLLVTSVQLAPLRLGFVPWWRDGRPSLRPVVNPDQWDGFPGERHRLLELVRPRAGSVVAVSGDLHATFRTASTAPENRVAELTVPSISAASFGAIVRRRLPFVPTAASERWLRLLNPHIADLDMGHHGAARLDIDAACITFETGPAPGMRRVLAQRQAHGR